MARERNGYRPARRVVPTFRRETYLVRHRHAGINPQLARVRYPPDTPAANDTIEVYVGSSMARRLGRVPRGGGCAAAGRCRRSSQRCKGGYESRKVGVNCVQA
eukprot:1131436-Prymnesium_polylepis.1